MFNVLKFICSPKHQLCALLKNAKNHYATGAISQTEMLKRDYSDMCDSENKFSVKGKNVVYVGGLGGIGVATSIQLCCKGIKSLVMVDKECDSKKGEKIQEANEKVKLQFMKVDLCSGQATIAKKMKEIYDQIGTIDVLINGAGMINDRDISQSVAVNLLGLIETTIAAVPLMSKGHCGKGGVICYISSVCGLEPFSCLAVQTAAKHGVMGFAKSLAHPDYHKLTGINHIMICPGPTKVGCAPSLVGLDTWDMSKKLTEKFMKVKTQPVESCAKNIVKAIEQGDNGSAWLIDAEKLTKLEIKNYWKITFKDDKKKDDKKKK